jgi:hypothetical protein
MQAINDGAISRFLTKPSPPEHLVPTLQAALTQYRLVTTERTLLEQTLRGCVKVLTDILALVNPMAFGRASRLKRYARHIATYLDLPDVWQFEVAAMLSQVDCVALPGRHPRNRFPQLYPIIRRQDVWLPVSVSVFLDLLHQKSL